MRRMREVLFSVGLLLSHDAFAAVWQREDSAVARPPIIKIADQPDRVTVAKPAGAFQIRGFYIGMTLGQFNQQVQKEFGQQIKGFQFKDSGFFHGDSSGCRVFGHTGTATDDQITALSKLPGVRVEQVSGRTGIYDVTDGVSIIENVLVTALAFPPCVFGLGDKSATIFDAVETQFSLTLPASCRQMLPDPGHGERTFCYVNGNLFSFSRFSSGIYSFAILDLATSGPIAAAAGVKPP